MLRAREEVAGVGELLTMQLGTDDILLAARVDVSGAATGDDLELWLDKKYVPRGYGWAFPAGDEVRIRCAEKRVRLLRHSSRSYFEVLRQKLKWNER